MARKTAAPDPIEPPVDVSELKTDDEPTEPAAPPEPPVWRWIGARLIEGTPVRFVLGVPPRDLTQTDIDALTDGERDQAMASGLYAAEKASE